MKLISDGARGRFVLTVLGKT